MSIDQNWIQDDRKVESFEEIRNIVKGKQKSEINLIDLMLNFDAEISKDVCEAIDGSGKDIQFIYECLEYFILIRPHKIKNLFALFYNYAKKNNYKGYETESKLLRKMLIHEGVIHNYGELSENESMDDIISDFPKESIERAIREDDVDTFLKLSTEPDFNSEKNIKIDKNNPIFKVNRDENISYLQLMAYFGSEKCFKRALMSNLYKDINLKKYAIAGGNYEIIQLLRQKEPNYFDGCFETSVQYHHYEVSDWLLRNYKCEKVSRLTCICYFNFLALNFFVENDIDVPPTKLESNIFMAVKGGNLANVRYFIETLGCDPEQKNDVSETPLQSASFYGYLSIVRYLVEKCGSDPNKKQACDVTPLDVASISGCFPVVQYLVEKCGCSIEHVNEPGIISFSSGNLSLSRYFVEKCGCLLEPRNKKGPTAMKNALINADIPAIKYLDEKCGCSLVKHVAQHDYEPLFVAFIGGQMELAKFIVDKCNNDAVNEFMNGQTPLHYASRIGYLDLVKYLVNDCKCSADQKDNYGQTPLHYAAKYGKLSVVKYLVDECGCNPLQRDNEGLTPLVIANKNRYSSVVEFMLTKQFNYL